MVLQQRLAWVFAGYLIQANHWVAFILLTLIGSKMQGNRTKLLLIAVES